MYCRYCGAQQPDGVNFCSVCGKELAIKEVPAPPPSEPNTPYEPASYEPVPYPPEAPIPAQPKRNMKRVLIAVVAAVLALALVSGGVAFALHYFSPEEALFRAFENTGEALEDVFAGSPNLHRASKNLTQLLEEEEFTLLLDATATGEDPGSVSMELTLDEDTMSGLFQVDILDGKEPIRGSLEYYIGRDQLAFALPSTTTDSYYFPLKNLSKALAASPLGKSMDKDTLAIFENLENALEEYDDQPDFEELYREELQKLKASQAVEEVEMTLYSTATPDKVYSYDIDYNALGNLLAAMVRNSADASTGAQELQEMLQAVSIIGAYLESLNPDILIAVRDGCATAIELRAQELRITLVLNGDDNPWSNVTLVVNEYVVFNLSLRETETGFSARVIIDGESLLAECNDKEKTLTLPIDGEELIWTYDGADGGAQFTTTVDAAGSVLTLNVALKPDGTIKPIAGTVNLMELTMEEVNALFDQWKAVFE